MIFTSFEFALFLPVAFLVYWMIPASGKWRNVFLLLASYFFYGSWDWRFLGLIVFSTLIDYKVGVSMLDSSRSRQKKLLFLSVFSNLSILFYFKYSNFLSKVSLIPFLSLGCHLVLIA